MRGNAVRRICRLLASGPPPGFLLIHPFKGPLAELGDPLNKPAGIAFIECLIKDATSIWYFDEMRLTKWAAHPEIFNKIGIKCNLYRHDLTTLCRAGVTIDPTLRRRDILRHD